MEQRLNPAYLGPGLIERSLAAALIIVSLGFGIALAGWGWGVTRISPASTTQENPIVIAPRGPTTPSTETKVRTQDKSSTGEIITREVTVFSNVSHDSGRVVTGWIYRDGAGQVPTTQYCYYDKPNANLSTTRVDIASNRKRLPNVNVLLVPDLEKALAKCQWWN